MHPALSQTAHRPWPLPNGPWAWTQSWHDLLFAHWPIPTSVLRPHIPADLEIDEYEGQAWIGLVPFWMEIRHRWLPAIPGAFRFAELNVRTYVQQAGKGGVWFFSLDAANTPAVKAARRFFHLPYFRADIAMEQRDGWFHFHSQRRGGAAEFAGCYRPSSDVQLSEPGSLAHWLTERYCLYTVTPSGKVLRGDIHHDVWPLQEAECQITSSTMLASQGIELPAQAPLLHFAQRIDTILWPLR
jgi:uncharacterized protein YqjF (DUF2071 family)